MEALASIIVSTFAISLIAFIGVITLALKDKILDKIVMLLVAFSAGALIGAAFLHIIPEAMENYFPERVFLFCLIGFSSFFLIEKIFHWRHCHNGKCPIHTFAYMNLFGDAIHNFIDGI